MAASGKGTQENPYTMSEYDELADAGTWQGGYVKDDGGNIVYMMAVVTIIGYSGYSGYSGYLGYGSSGSDYDPWGSDPDDNKNPWDDDNNDDNNDDNSGGASGNTGGITGEGGGNTGDGGNTGGGGNHSNINSRTIQALNIVEQFENCSTVAFYTKISKQSFIRDLRNQIVFPSKINQGHNGTCGIAVICKYLAECMPEKYAEAAISLYKTGKYEEWGLQVCDESKTGTDAQAKAIGTTALDCIVQGAFRNSYNDITDYNPFTDGNGWGSITWPTEINSFFETVLNKECNDTIRIWQNDYYNRLSEIDFKKYFVIALIHNEDNTNNFGVGAPNHYVQILNVNKDHSVQYWQWGETNPYTSKSCRCWGLYIIER